MVVPLTGWISSIIGVVRLNGDSRLEARAAAAEAAVALIHPEMGKFGAEQCGVGLHRRAQIRHDDADMVESPEGHAE
jgi:hypothetical protein